MNIKPETIRKFLRLIEIPVLLEQAPNGQNNGVIRQLSHDLKIAFSEYSPCDLVDIQSLI
jgi:hypothetical protein